MHTLSTQDLVDLVGDEGRIQEPDNGWLKGRKQGLVLAKKLEVLDYAEKLVKAGCFSEKAVQARFTGKVNLAQGMLGRWKIACDKYRWRTLPQEVLNKYKEVPNFAREMHNQVADSDSQKRAPGPDVDSAAKPVLPFKGVNAAYQVPTDLKNEFDKILASRVSGLSVATRIAEPLGDRDMRHAMTGVIKSYNARLKKRNAAAVKKNAALLTKLRAGQISPADALRMRENLVPYTDARATRNWASRFRVEYNWGSHQVGMTGNFLPYDHPEMAHVRDKVALAVKQGQIHPRLLINYDQLWKLAFRGRKRKFYKTFEGAGQKMRRSNARLKKIGRPGRGSKQGSTCKCIYTLTNQRIV
jgi:hypothetical protein